MYRYKRTIYTCILTLAFFSQTKAQMYSSSWGADNTIDENPDIIALYKLENWQVDNNKTKQQLNLPLFTQHDDTLILNNSFNISADSITADYVFKSLGFNGCVEISINNTVIESRPNSLAPFEFTIDSKLLIAGGKNNIRIVLYKSVSLDKSFPVFTNTYTEPEYIGVWRPFYIDISKTPLITGFSYSIQYEESNPDFSYSYNVNSNILNALSKTEGLMLEQNIMDSDGKEVRARAISISKQNNTVSGALSLLPSRFWSPENPVFLNFTFTLKRFAQTLHSESRKIALRSFNAGKKNLLLNNLIIPVRGINYYQNLKFSQPVSIAEKIKSDLKAIKNAGFNAVRFVSHIPDERFLSVADTLGLLVFFDMPVRRYPTLAFKQDILLENLQEAIQSTIMAFKKHPSFAAIGLGQEVLLSDPGTSKFFIILDGSIERTVPFLTYISPVPEKNVAIEQAADFYMLDIYDSFPAKETVLRHTNINYSLAGKAAMSASADYLEINNPVFGVDHRIHIKKNINAIMNLFSLQGGFLESYMDWNSKFATHQTYANDNPYVVSNGFYDSTFTKKEWAGQLTENAWNDSSSAQLPVQEKDKSSNVFSITMFFSSLLFLFFYRRYPRLSENYRRSLKHPYGFYVEMRERRIIPVFNSFVVGVHNTLILTIFLTSYIYYYNDSLLAQEVLSVVSINKEIYNYLIEISQSEFKLIPFIFIWVYLYPIVIGLFLKIYGLFTSAKIRLRQAMAIGMWSGAPLIFLLPFSIAAYHLILSGYMHYLLYLLAVFVIWIHFRLINGIRVLVLAKFRTIFILLLLSYIMPLVIFSIFFSPQPMWSDYVITLLNSHELF